jgi:hypothetical protein
MRRLASTIRLDAGWLYVVAGLCLCAAAILVPAQRDLEGLRRQRDRLADEKAVGEARLDAYRSFLRQLEREDPPIIRRLAAAQLNLVPAGETPVLLAASRTATVSEWIEGNVRVSRRQPKPPPETLLSRLVEGRLRLWVLAGGMVIVFMGLLLDDARAPARHGGRPALPRWPVGPGPRSDGDLNPWYDE